MPAADIVLRWLHILPAIALMGGTIFMRFALAPAAETLRLEERARFMQTLRSRWAKVVMLSILLLLVSGLTNFVLTVQRYELPKPYHMLFGIKFLLALCIFFLASVLSGKSALAQRVQKNPGTWINLTLLLAVALVCLSGVLKNIEHKPKSPAAVVAETAK